MHHTRELARFLERGEARWRGERIETIQGVATPMRSHFERPLESSVVVMEVVAIDYEGAIPEIFFSTVALMKK